MPPIALIGQVTKAGVMNKTVTVTVSRKVTHPRVGKELIRSKKFLVHDPNNECKLGNSVVIQNCRPLSARKSFVFVKTLAESEKQRMMERFAAEQESVAQAAHGTGAAH